MCHWSIFPEQPPDVAWCIRVACCVRGVSCPCGVLCAWRVVSVWQNLTPYNGGDPTEAEALIGAAELKMMKNTAILISV